MNDEEILEKARKNKNSGWTSSYLLEEGDKFHPSHAVEVFPLDAVEEAILNARRDEQRKLGMQLALVNIEVKSFEPLFEVDLSFIQREAHKAQKSKTLREMLEWLKATKILTYKTEKLALIKEFNEKFEAKD